MNRLMRRLLPQCQTSFLLCMLLCEMCCFGLSMSDFFTIPDQAVSGCIPDNTCIMLHHRSKISCVCHGLHGPASYDTCICAEKDHQQSHQMAIYFFAELASVRHGAFIFNRPSARSLTDPHSLQYELVGFKPRVPSSVSTVLSHTIAL